jgi:transposase-like protein
MPKTKRPRKQYAPEKRAQILAAAQKEGLTASAVQKRFGVTPVTYYSWRKKAGAGKRRANGAVSTARRGNALGSQLRDEIQARIRSLLPGIVRAEVNRYLDAALGSVGRRRRR